MYNVAMKVREAKENPERDYGREIAFKIKKAMLAMDGIAEQTIQASLGVTLSQFWVLSSLEHHEGAPQKAICRLLSLTPAAVSRTTEALREKGLLARDENPACRREHMLTLTDEGRRRASEGASLVRREFDELYRAMDATQKDALEQGLDTLLEALRTHHRNY
jgi:DNA-binding MarR family transcriptional regulator